MTSNLRSARRRFAASTSGSSASKSRKGWYRSIERPRSAQRARSSVADHEEATKSGSKISTPSKPAAAAATSLSSSVPDRHTVAIAVRRPAVRPGASASGTTVSAVISGPFHHPVSVPRGPCSGYLFPASEQPAPTTAGATTGEEPLAVLPPLSRDDCGQVRAALARTLRAASPVTCAATSTPRATSSSEITSTAMTAGTTPCVGQRPHEADCVAVPLPGRQPVAERLGARAAPSARPARRTTAPTRSAPPAPCRGRRPAARPAPSASRR